MQNPSDIIEYIIDALHKIFLGIALAIALLGILIMYPYPNSSVARASAEMPAYVSGLIYLAPDVPNIVQNELVKHLEKVPEPILADMTAHQYTIHVVINSEQYDPEHAEWCGSYNQTGKTITIDMRKLRGVLHEIGHYVDCEYLSQYGQPYSSSEACQEIYQEEHESLATISDEAAKNTTNPQEYFAEAFNLFIDGKGFADKAPKTYNTISNLIGGNLP